MPASRASLATTDAYRARLLTVRQSVVRVTAQQWAGVNLDDLDGSFERWLTATSAIAAGAQRANAALTGAYLGAYLRHELGDNAPAPAPVEVDRYADVARDGRPLAQALVGPLVTVRLRLAQGQGRDLALASGLARATRLVGAEVLAAPRAALADALAADDRTVGWRRVADGGACGACLGAATGAIRSTDDVPEVHDHCRCVAEPVVAGARDHVARPTGADLFAAMTGSQQDAALGATTAALVRSGEVDLTALVARSPQRTMPDQLTQAPIGAVAPG